MKVCLLSIRDDISEMIELLDTLDYELDNIFVQNRRRMDPKLYLGRGKIEQVREFVQASGTDMVVISDEIKPHHKFNLEKELGIEVFDRIWIILEIFKQRAVSEEAKLQVELAGVQYELPWLKELIHRSTLGEHPGLMAGGEHQVRQHYSQMTKHSRVIRKRLKSLEKDRDQKRKHRHREGFVLVSITGYTNAGKSTLFNALTLGEVLVDDRMFATLSTTTRRLGDQQPKILLTDTVGFIENLPPWLIKAFNSTMEEVFQSDVVVITIDATDGSKEILRKMETCLEVIQTGTRRQTIVAAINKADLLSSENIQKREEMIQECFSTMDLVVISAKERTGLEDLNDILFKAQQEIVNTIVVKVHVTDDDFTPSFVNWLYENTVVKEKVEEGGEFLFTAVAPVRLLKDLKRRCGEAGCVLEVEE